MPKGGGGCERLHVDDVVLLCCDAVWTRRLIATFRRNILPSYSGHGVTTQTNNTVIFTAVKTSALTASKFF
jgi:uncharacterized caspase-like protein